MWYFNGQCNHWGLTYRAVASYVTTVNQLYISLLILDYLRYLPRLCGKRVVGFTMNSELRAAWNLSFCYVNYCYSAVIALGKFNEYCAEIVSYTPTSLQLPLSTILFCYTEVLCHMFSWHNCNCSIVACICCSPAQQPNRQDYKQPSRLAGQTWRTVVALNWIALTWEHAFFCAR